MQSKFMALASGLIFGWGLILGGMTSPLKVKAFLDLLGAWDPSLALVMGGAIAVGFFAFRTARSKRQAWSGAPMSLPQSNVINGRLILGGVLFGAGWGIAGLCPGPAVVVAASGSAQALVFVVAMLAGMSLHDRFFAGSR